MTTPPHSAPGTVQPASTPQVLDRGALHLDALSPEAQLSSVLHATGFARLDRIGWLRITGEDRVRWLNGMVTNAIQELGPGHGCYNFILNAQGRIQADGYAFAEPDALLLETSRESLPQLTALLDRYIIMDDVLLRDVSEARSGLSIIGPGAEATLRDLGLLPTPLEPLAFTTRQWKKASIAVLHAYDPLVPRFELWTDPATVDDLENDLLSVGSVLCSPTTIESLRVLEGAPLYGIDITDRQLPQETAQTRALHFAKGCYLGQEIVERIRSRGNVHRTFTSFRLEGAQPEPGATLESEGKPVGELTSIASVPLPAGTVSLALGYVRREALDRNLPLVYPGGNAIPSSSPYRID